MKIIEFNVRIMKLKNIIKNPSEDNAKTFENHRIPSNNNENHMKILEFYGRITKIMKILQSMREL